MMKRRKTLLSFSISLLLISSCSQSNKVVTENTTNATVVSSVPPFQTKEPRRYRATRTITTVNASGETIVTKNWVAKDGEMRRDESETASQRVVYLTLLQGRFVVLPNEKLFADLANDEPRESNAEEESESSPDRLLHTDPIATSYQKVGTETVSGRDLQKYRVIVNSSSDGNVSVSETLVWIDEALHMPVKSETKSPDGARTTMELSDVALDVDKTLFQIPEDYEKIAFRELRKRFKRIE